MRCPDRPGRRGRPGHPFGRVKRQHHPPAAHPSRPAPTVPAGFITGAAANNASQFIAATGVTPGILEHYVHFGAPFNVAFASPAVPMIQIEPNRPLSDVVAGQEDTWLRAYATAAVRYKHPLILGFAPEMNGDWYRWGWKHVTPAVYIAAWRHVVTVFRQAGAANVRWLWTVNVSDLGSNVPSPRVSSVRQWYPGDQWVTWVGMDGYCYVSSQGFTNIFGATLHELRALTSRPVLISETAIAPEAGQAAKIPALFTGARQAGVLGLVWFNLPGNRAWPLARSAAVAAFRKAATG